MIVIFIPEDPTPKARARVGRRGAWTPRKTAEAERMVRHFAAVAMAGREQLTGPLIVEIAYTLAMPKSWSGRRLAEMNDTAHVQLPDVDNLLKLTLDALNGVVWADDRQIYSLSATKRWGRWGETVVKARAAVEAPIAPALKVAAE
ncbi:MAG: RusA family crossover junction endodeoxyribonuclease [Pseudomonadota bacterium]